MLWSRLFAKASVRPQAKDNPTVASLEHRLSQIREEWRTLERQFTPQYLDMDPHARALRTRIANLEQQLDAERSKSRQDALAEAKEELASAQATKRRLQQQLAMTSRSVQNFSRRMAEFQAMQEELRGLGTNAPYRQAAPARSGSERAGTQATHSDPRSRSLARNRMAAPCTGATPASALMASLVLGFLAVWFVEFFDRAEPVARRTFDGHHSAAMGVGDNPGGRNLAATAAAPALAGNGAGAVAACATRSEN